MATRPRRETRRPLAVELLEEKTLLSSSAHHVAHVHATAAEASTRTAANAAYVDSLYANVLHRAPDAAGESYWVGVLNSGANRRTVLRAFRNASEMVASALGGSPAGGGEALTSKGLSAIPTSVHTGNLAQDQAYVSSLYTNLLGQAPSASGQGYWVGLLRSGVSPNAVKDAFLYSTAREQYLADQANVLAGYISPNSPAATGGATATGTNTTGTGTNVTGTGTNNNNPNGVSESTIITPGGVVTGTGTNGLGTFPIAAGSTASGTGGVSSGVVGTATGSSSNNSGSNTGTTAGTDGQDAGGTPTVNGGASTSSPGTMGSTGTAGSGTNGTTPF